MTLLAWLSVLNQAASSQLNEKKEYLKLAQQMEKSRKREEATKKEKTEREVSLKKENSMIRVLLKNEKEDSYFHPDVTLKRNGEKFYYGRETVDEAGGRDTRSLRIKRGSRSCLCPASAALQFIKAAWK